MKSISILFAAVLFLGMHTGLMAQGGAGDNTDVTASALVLMPLELTNNETNVNFGAVQVNSNPYLDPENEDNDDDVEFAGVGTKEVARFTVVGAASARILFGGETSITLSNGTDDITFEPEFSYAEGDVDAPRGGEQTDILTTPVNLSGTTGTGSGTVWMGGSITIGNVSQGEYTGTYNLSVEYN